LPVCWGKSDEIIVGNKDGTISIHRVTTPSQTERIATIPVPDSLEEGQTYSGNNENELQERFLFKVF
jgi:hypothetical protein